VNTAGCSELLRLVTGREEITRVGGVGRGAWGVRSQAKTPFNDLVSENPWAVSKTRGIRVLVTHSRPSMPILDTGPPHGDGR
jgi:hypothetical protein